MLLYIQAKFTVYSKRLKKSMMELKFMTLRLVLGVTCRHKKDQKSKAKKSAHTGN